MGQVVEGQERMGENRCPPCEWVSPIGMDVPCVFLANKWAVSTPWARNYFKLEKFGLSK